MNSSEDEEEILTRKVKKIRIDDGDVGNWEEIESAYYEVFSAIESTSLDDQRKETSSRKHTSKKSPSVLYAELTLNEENILCGLSNDQIKVLDPTRISDTETFSTLTYRHNGLSGLRCSRTNPSLFFTSSNKEGTIFQWDRRQAAYKPALKYNISKIEGVGSGPIGGVKPILSFDINQNDLVLCGGTELVDEDSYLLFWDVRSTKLLGAYWESHSDDITTVKFSPVNGTYLATGSTDGLLNVFNLVATTEDDALEYSFNTESSVDLVNWGNFQDAFTSENNYTTVAGITHMSEAKIYDIKEGDLLSSYDRAKIAETMKRSNPEAVYIVGCYNLDAKGTLGLLTCSLSRNSCARCISINKDSLVPQSLFENQLSVIQTATRFQTANRWCTFDDDDCVKIWEPRPWSKTESETETVKAKGSKLKEGAAKHRKTKRTKPY